MTNFRDPSNFAVEYRGRWYRVADKVSSESLRRLRESSLYEELIADRKILKFREVSAIEAEALFLPLMSKINNKNGILMTRAEYSIFITETAPLIIYPNEWTNLMLSKAAKLVLELKMKLNEVGLDIKDPNATNIQFFGSEPYLIDLGTVTRFRLQPSWVGSRLFMEQFLNPLLASWATGVEATQFRGANFGLQSKNCMKILGVKSKLRPSIFVLLKMTIPSGHPIKQKIVENEADKNLILKAHLRLIKRFSKLVRLYSSQNLNTTWADYSPRNHYSSQEIKRKRDFTEQFMASCEGLSMTLVDLGGNDGMFSQITKERKISKIVVIDPDEGVLDLTSSSRESILDSDRTYFVKSELMLASNGDGKIRSELIPLTSRVGKCIVLCFAVLHHAVITQGNPLLQAVEALSKFDGDLLIEFADEKDEKVRQLISDVVDWKGQYSLSSLIEILSSFYQEVSIIGVTSEHRHMVSCRNKI